MKNILEYLEHTAVSSSGSVIDENGFCSYREMMDTSMRIGSFLAEKVAPCQPIAVLMDKGITALSCFWGIVYAGCYYSLFNADLPVSRLQQVQSVLDAPILITDEKHLDMARQITDDHRILMAEQLKTCAVNEAVLRSIRDSMIDVDPLYVNFTSGSTGIPKGVVICHRSVIDFINVFTDLFHITGEDVLANQAPFDFDVSVKDIYSALKTGADLVIVPKHLFSQPAPLLDFLCEHKITTMIWAVSALCLISTFHGLDYRTPETVRKILFSGEVMPMKHLKNWMEHLPQAEFVNLYGPTEITCNCTYHRIDRSRDYSSGIPIGKAFPNERVFLLDSENHPVSQPDVPGELCVSGTAVGLGYFKSPELTAAGFPQNPANHSYLEGIYRTGDLACYTSEGELKFLGRKDFQIKYKGHRIELEEIEKAMMAISGIERACCIFDPEKSKLYGFYVGVPDKKELHKSMSDTLPIFMVPGKLVQKESLPLTKNGKIDRKALMSELGEKKR